MAKTKSSLVYTNTSLFLTHINIDCLKLLHCWYRNEGHKGVQLVR